MRRGRAPSFDERDDRKRIALVHAEVQFSGVTKDGLLRETVFKGLREDLDDIPHVEAPPLSPARGGVRSSPILQYKRPENPHVGVPRGNILQLLPDAVVPTKDELASYWRSVAKL